MASLALAVAGSYIGGAMAGGTAAVAFGMTGAQLGWMGGAMLGSVLFPPKMPDGPRLDDLSVQVSSYGASITRLWGTSRIAGNVIWSTDLVEHAQEQGGKGGGSYTSYSYTCSFAVSLCEGPITSVRRMWADGKLIYDVSTGNEGLQKGFSASSVVFYTGTETQEVDPTIQMDKSDTPAYRGQAYVVISDLALEHFGNRIPNLTCEVVHGIETERMPSLIVSEPGAITGKCAIDPYTGNVWCPGRVDGMAAVIVYDPVKKTVIDRIPLGTDYGSGLVDAIEFIPQSGLMMIMSDQRADVYDPISRKQFALGTINWQALHGYLCGPPPYYYPGIFSGANDTQGGFIQTTIGSYVPWPSVNPHFDAYSRVYDQWVVDSPCGDDPDSEMGTDMLINLVLNDYVYVSTLYIECNGAAYTVAAQSDAVEVHAWDGYVVDFQEAYPHEPLELIAFDLPGTLRDVGQWIAFDAKRHRILIATEMAANGVYPLIWLEGSGTPTSFMRMGCVELPQPPQSIGSLRSFYYHQGTDKYLASWSITNRITVHNADTLAIEYNLRTDPNANGSWGQAFWFFELPDWPDRAFWSGGYGDIMGLHRVWWGPQVEPASAKLSSIVTDLSLSVGLSAEQIDVTDLSDDVFGFVIARQGTARSAIEQLMMAFLFDAVESEGKVKFVKRGRAVALTIDQTDLGIHLGGAPVPTLLPLSRADEATLPRTVTIKYPNYAADYQTSAQCAKRLTGRAESEITADLPVVMSDVYARSVADAALFSAWVARTTVSWATSLKHAQLEPTDLVMIQGNAIRITKRTLDRTLLRYEGAFDTGVSLVGGALASAGDTPTQSITKNALTFLLLADTAMLRDADDDAGYYMALCGYELPWPGAALYKSWNDGVSWGQIASTTIAASIGVATNILGEFPDNTFDEFNTLSVRLVSGTLASTTKLSVLNGDNLAILGNEILQFKRAVLESDGTYTLSGFLRGRRGTSTANHSISQRFLLVTAGAVFRDKIPAGDIGLDRLYIATTLGDSLKRAAAVSFRPNGAGLLPLSPVLLGGGRDAGGNLTIKWVRRTRLGGEWRDLTDAALGEVTELYSVEIYNNAYYQLVTRTLAATQPSLIYTAVQQIADFGSVQPIVYVRVYQQSETAGRGSVLEGEI